jgi:hypothetical protein
MALLAQAELDFVQLAAAQLRWLYLAGDPLESQARVVENEFNRLDALGRSAGGRAATMDKLIELFSQPWVQMFHEPRGKAAAFAWCEAQPRVRSNGELDATADHLAVAAGMGPAVASVGGQVARPDGTLRFGSGVGWVSGH